MKSPVFAIAYSLWSRHRVGFVVTAGFFALWVILFPFLTSVTPARATAALSAVPLVGIFAFVLNALLFVEDAGSLSSRYPRFMLTAPVRTRTLALWPMFFAAGGGGLLWATAALSIYRPAGYQAPVLIPALALAGLMAWAQAIAWIPIQSFLVRELTTVVLVAILGALGAFPIWLAVRGPGWEILAVFVLLVYVAGAFFVGWAAVASDRHGVAWRFWPAQPKLARLVRRLAPLRAVQPFRSTFRAQLAYEWSCHGLMLNAFVAIMLFLIWGILLLKRGTGTPQWLLIILCLLPIVVTTTIAASGASFGRLRPFWNHQRGFIRENTFVATRPMTSAGLVAAKFRMAAASVLINWTLAVVGTAGWLVISSNRAAAAILVRDFFSRYPGVRGFAIIGLVCILLPALSWRLLTGSLVPVLTGRRWVADGAVYLYLSLLAAAGGCGYWLANSEPERVRWFYAVIPFLVVTIAFAKGVLAVGGFQMALARRLVSWRYVASVLVLWSVLTSCGVALGILLGPPPFVSLSWPILTLSVATIVPLARFPLATLALDWNRHR